jgi:hypothetical protein
MGGVILSIEKLELVSIVGELPHLNDAIVACLQSKTFHLENAAKLVPIGLYAVEVSQSPKFKRKLPLVWNANVPANRGIRIHVGNTVKASSGCMLVGMGRDVNKRTLSESANAETMVTMLCRNVTELVVTCGSIQ